MSYKYNKTLIIGATSGIGEAYANKVVEAGKKVIVVGRRKERLDAFVQKHGEEQATAVQFDIKNLSSIPRFVKDVTSAHPDLDCILLNSGIQRGFDFSKPDTVDLDVLGEELLTNYTAFIHLTHAFIPYLQKKSNETALMYTTSGLALIPIPRCPVYCASKAALHHFILTLRTQLSAGPGNIKVVEIFPPAVQTELHDEKHQPDIKNGGSMGVPLKDFTEQSWAKIVNGDEQVAIGMAVGAFENFENKRQEMYHDMVKAMSGGK